MLRSQFTLIYTSAATFAESDVIEKMIALYRLPERTPEQENALVELQENLPLVEQVRITVATANGVQQARYTAFHREASAYFTEQTGLSLPLPKEPQKREDGGFDEVTITLDDWQDAVLSSCFGAAASLAATVSYESRRVQPIISAAGMAFDQAVGWEKSPLPGEIATVAGWVENCPATLQTAWSNKAYDANPNLWRRKDDEAAKNFDAVSVK